MNIGRLVPQIVYYFYSYVQLVKNGEITTGQKLTFRCQLGTLAIFLPATMLKNWAYQFINLFVLLIKTTF